MNFAPKTEDEVKFKLFSAGEYTATVAQAVDEVSETGGNDMIHLNLRIKDDDGNVAFVHDYLLEAMAAKLRHFCAAANLMAEYDSGSLTTADCKNQEVRVKLGIQKAKGSYPEKNVIVDYIPAAASPRRPSPPTQQSATTNATTQPATPKVLAWKSFLAVWSRFIGEFPAEIPKRDEYWQKCFDGYFPGKQTEQIVDLDWKRFETAVGTQWDPMNGWKKPKAVEPPFAEEKVFDDSDIPF
jgi:hypothetical protein